MSAPSPPTIHYEVYTNDGSNRWNLHARYERHERDAALLDAKTVEKTLQIPAKVIREVYYPGNNMSEESLVYAGNPELRAKMAARASTVPSYRGRGGGGARAPAALPGAGAAAKENIAAGPTASLASAMKVLLVMTASLTVAGLATKLASMAIEPMAASFSETVEQLILFLTFVVIFVATALPLSSSVLKFSLLGSLGRAKPKPFRPPPPPVKIQPPPPPREELEVEEEELDWEGLKDDEEALPPVTEDNGTQPSDAPPADWAPPEAAETVAAEPAEQQFLRYVNGLIGAVRKIRSALDAYNLFGLDLVMAGAIDLLGHHAQLPVEHRRQLLKGAIEAMGVKPATAQAFADKYEDYLGEQRYMPMILAGRSTMESFLAGQDSLNESIAPVFELWNRPQSQAPAVAARIMTIMFTDMVGSTDYTSAAGDKAAQTMVRRHNSIVRNALAQYSGKEIKHTGDGIMASFASAASGVEAAIAIQRSIAQHNADHAEQPLHIRIGINAGEPIEEEEDLFGTTVQLASRLCARCAPDEILCSNVVKELATGRSLPFALIGAEALKGFKDPIPLIKVDWSPA